MDYLLRLFRRPQKEEDEEDESIDLMNPFPDPVVIELTDVIDLHSIPPRQVKAVVEDFLQSARSRRLSHVRIIHGKGICVQREMVRAILARTPFVISFTDAPMEAGGWGATVAMLDVSSEEG
ncbi:MAG: Smr/MutS family protein [Acidobacteriota bacterium]